MPQQEKSTSVVIPINESVVSGEEVQTVNARDLHEFLKVGKDFSNWIKDRIKQFNFEENRDFIVFADIGEKPQGGRPSKDYHLTLDMAKELSMVERNAKGKLARQYFIECERKLKTALPAPRAPIFDLAYEVKKWALAQTIPFTARNVNNALGVQGVNQRIHTRDILRRLRDDGILEQPLPHQYRVPSLKALPTGPTTYDLFRLGVIRACRFCKTEYETGRNHLYPDICPECIKHISVTSSVKALPASSSPWEVPQGAILIYPGSMSDDAKSLLQDILAGKYTPELLSLFTKVAEVMTSDDALAKSAVSNTILMAKEKVIKAKKQEEELRALKADQEEMKRRIEALWTKVGIGEAEAQEVQG
jgi:anti-repressor protein